MADQTTGTPPVEHPVVTLGGRSLSMKYSLLADYILDKRGIDTKQLIPLLTADKPGRAALVIDLFAACVAHNFVEAGDPVPTSEQWCTRLSSDQLRELSTKLVKVLFPNAPTLPAGAKPGEEATAEAQPVQ